jgi:putative membrane protein
MALSGKILFPLAIFSVSLTQCAGDRRSADGPDAQKNAGMLPASGLAEARPVAQGREDKLTDRQIAMVSDAFHTAAIDQAKVAYPQTKDAAVKKFAQTLLAEHTRAKQEETELFVELRLSPMESPLSTEIGVESGKVLFNLREASARELDDAYVAAQISSHQRFLDALERELLPNAGEPRLRRVLEAYRPRLELHLEMARGLKQALESP